MTCHPAAFLHMLPTVPVVLVCPTLLSSGCERGQVEIWPWGYKETRLTAPTGSWGPNFFQSKPGTVIDASSCCNGTNPMERTPLWQQDPGHWGCPWHGNTDARSPAAVTLVTVDLQSYRGYVFQMFLACIFGPMMGNYAVGTKAAKLERSS